MVPSSLVFFVQVQAVVTSDPPVVAAASSNVSTPAASPSVSMTPEPVNASTTAKSTVATASQEPAVSGKQVAADFDAAPPCLQLPAANNSAPDQASRLWGWSDSQNTSCAFKDSAGHAVWYAEYIPGDWLHTAACTMPPFPDNSVVDSTLKVQTFALAGQHSVHALDQACRLYVEALQKFEAAVRRLQEQC